MLINLLGVFIGGGCGSVLRSIVSGKIGSHWGIMTVNLCGAFLIGFLFEWLGSKSDLQPEIKGFLITGLLGGFTTFSTYMLDFGVLINNNHYTEAAVYLFSSLFVGIVCMFGGIYLGKNIFC